MKKKYNLITDIKDLKNLIILIKKIGHCAIDTETNSLNIEKAALVGLSIAVNEGSAYYIPINHKDLNSKARKQCCDNREDEIPGIKDSLKCEIGLMQQLYQMVGESEKLLNF